MEKKEEKMHLPKVSYDEFFTSQEERDLRKLEHIHIIPIKEIKSFPNHPYKVRDDDEMLDLAENIKEWGVSQPVLVRPKANGGYEMISGHRRKRACEIAGIKEIKAIIREMTDEEATIQMVNSNKQREKVLPSEKAFAYKMKMEALKKQGKRNDLTSDPLGQKLKTSREKLAEETGDSATNIQRYIRLTELTPELLQMVDDEKIALRPAVEISYLRKEEQDMLLDAIEYLEVTPSHYQTIRMRKKSQESELTSDDIDDILGEEKPNQKEQIKFKVEKVKDYFPKGFTTEQMQTTMTKLLENYKVQWQNKEKQRQYVR